MRSLEILLALLVAVSAFSLFFRRASRAFLAALLLLDTLVLALHAVLEGPHWQMFPLYLAIVLFAAVIALPRSLWRSLAATAMLVLLVSTCAASAVMPMFRLPRPTGPYPIGTRIFYLVDDHPYQDAFFGPQQHRGLMIQIWYPAAPSRMPYAPYRRRAETSLLSSYQSVIPTHSRLDAPVAASSNGRFPVLLFNPAWNGRRTQNTYLVEDLASHGYVVIGIDHTGNSGPIAFPDGRVFQEPYIQQMDFKLNTLEEIEAEGEREVNRQTRDNIFVLDQLEKMNADPASPFYQRLDTNRAGALGHSFGGAVAALASLEDPRIRSAVDLDGSLWGRVQRDGIPKPFMFITEDAAPYPQQLVEESNEARIDEALDKSDFATVHIYGVFHVGIHGSTHTSFTDHSLLSPFKRWSGAGTVPAGREYAIIREYTLAFFDKTLRSQDPPLLKQLGSPMPEVSVEDVPGSKPRPALTTPPKSISQ